VAFRVIKAPRCEATVDFFEGTERAYGMSMASTLQIQPERRHFRRLHVPVFCRPAGIAVMTHRHPIDLSLSGVRIYSDQEFARGELLTLEFIADMPGTFTAEVVWIAALPPGSPAPFDVGLRFRSVGPDQAAVLEGMLAKPG
jgi:hypothetical protein